MDRADVRVLGWVDTETLEGLYAISRAFVFPSLYEGFGLPVLEAMARDLPVACSGRARCARSPATPPSPSTPTRPRRSRRRWSACRGRPGRRAAAPRRPGTGGPLHLGGDRTRDPCVLPPEPWRRQIGGYSRPVHHDELSGANPRGGDVNLRSAPQMEEYRAIVRRIRADRPSSILDWGCGHGQVTNLLNEAGPRRHPRSTTTLPIRRRGPDQWSATRSCRST